MMRTGIVVGSIIAVGLSPLHAEENANSKKLRYGSENSAIDPNVAAPAPVVVDPYLVEPGPIVPTSRRSEIGAAIVPGPEGPELAYKPHGLFPSVRGFWFRRYAGSVEMRTKTWYPLNYSGSYYFNGWRPGYIRDDLYPANPLAVNRFWHEPGSDFHHAEVPIDSVLQVPAGGESPRIERPYMPPQTAPEAPLVDPLDSKLKKGSPIIAPTARRRIAP